MSKLSPEAVRKIKKLYHKGYTTWEIARIFKIAEVEVVKLVNPKY